MRPFNIELYAKSAEEALRQIAMAIKVDAPGLRDIARASLAQLKQRYQHNGYLFMQVDQQEAQEKCTCFGPPMQPCGPNCKYPYTDEGGK